MSKRRRNLLRSIVVLVLSAPALSAGIAAREPASLIVLAEEGITRYSIVIAAEAHAAEQLAAEELALFLRKMTGATFPVRHDDTPATDTEIVLGNTSRRNLNDLPPALRIDNWEGFAIVREKTRLLIMGNVPRATLYGVYDFLDVELGVRFLAHHVNHIPWRPTLKIAAKSRSYGPPLERRTIWEGGLLGDATLRNRMNGISYQVLDEKKLGGVKMIGRPTHTFQAFLPHETYFADHPEYFAFIDGKRRDSYRGIITQPCMTNPDVLRISMEIVLSWLEEAHQQNPYNKYVVSVSANDSPWHCQCDDCRSLNVEEGVTRGGGGPQVRVVNSIAERVAREYPNALIKTMFYQSDTPNRTKPASNVIIEGTSSIDWRYRFDDLSKPGMQLMNDRFTQWRRTAGNGSLYVWTKHTLRYGDYFKPNPNLRYIAHNIRVMNEKYRVKGCFAQNTQSPGTDFQTLRYYLLARAMWRPQNDSRSEIEEFCRFYYGTAAEHVLRFLDFMHDDYGEKAPSRGDEERIFTRIDEERYIRIADEILSEAEASVDTYNHRLWVATLRLPVWKTVLNHAFEDMENDPDYAAPDSVRIAGRRFLETARAIRVTHMGESYQGNNAQTERSYYRDIRRLLRSGIVEDPADPWISDDDGLAVADLIGVRHLDLCGSDVTDTGLAVLAGLTQLRSLDLRYTVVTDEGLVHLEQLENLSELYLGGDAKNVGTNITDRGIQSLENLKKLEVLTLGHTNVGNESMKIIRSMRHLRHLELWSTKITDDGLADVVTLRDLEHLSIYTTALTDSGIGDLEQLRKLKLLNLYDVTQVTDDAVDALRRAIPGVHIRQY
ncbi:MAG: DUF4838 domain-containing protein [Fuerstiella sp.]|nr:DUF4838 domain-containing protein [Fuerstiella sp.]